MLDFTCLILAGTLYTVDIDHITLIEPNVVTKQPENNYVFVQSGRTHRLYYVPDDHELYTADSVEFMQWCRQEAYNQQRR